VAIDGLASHARPLGDPWPEYDLDDRTRALLRYAAKLTESPSFVDGEDLEALRRAGWNERDIWEITALASFFNFTGRLEAATDLPPDEIPEGADMAEAKGA